MYMCASSEGSCKTAWMCRLAGAITGRLQIRNVSDKYHIFVSWLMYAHNTPDIRGKSSTDLNQETMDSTVVLQLDREKYFRCLFIFVGHVCQLFNSVST